MPGKRSLRNRVYICDLSYHEGETALTARPATTPECEPHTPEPSGYIQCSDWADMMMETHEARACRGCGLWLIWEPKENRELGRPSADPDPPIVFAEASPGPGES
jgi:hypothetical protein